MVRGARAVSAAADAAAAASAEREGGGGSREGNREKTEDREGINLLISQWKKARPSIGCYTCEFLIGWDSCWAVGTRKGQGLVSTF